MKLKNIVLFAGWAIYITSFFLPAIDAYEGPYPGWAAALVTLFETLDDVLALNLFGIYLFSFTPCNILMMLSPFIVFLTKKKKYLHWYRISMCAATLLVGSWFFYNFWHGDADSLLSGYYLWFSSFLLVTISLFIKRPQNTAKD